MKDNRSIYEKLYNLTNNSPYYNKIIKSPNDFDAFPYSILNDAILSKEYRHILNVEYTEGRNNSLYGKPILHNNYSYMIYWLYDDLQKMSRILARHRYCAYNIKCTAKRCINHYSNNGYNPKHINDNIYISHDSREISFSCFNTSNSEMNEYYRYMILQEPEWLQFNVNFYNKYMDYLKNNGYMLPNSVRYIELILPNMIPIGNHEIYNSGRSDIEISKILYSDVLLYYAFSDFDLPFRYFEDLVFAENPFAANNEFSSTVYLSSLINTIFPIIRYPMNELPN